MIPWKGYQKEILQVQEHITVSISGKSW